MHCIGLSLVQALCSASWWPSMEKTSIGMRSGLVTRDRNKVFQWTTPTCRPILFCTAWVFSCVQGSSSVLRNGALLRFHSLPRSLCSGCLSWWSASWIMIVWSAMSWARDLSRACSLLRRWIFWWFHGSDDCTTADEADGFIRSCPLLGGWLAWILNAPQANCWAFQCHWYVVRCQALRAQQLYWVVVPHAYGMTESFFTVDHHFVLVSDLPTC